MGYKFVFYTQKGLRNMKPRIDDLDRAIHECLREDARMSSSEIARRLGYVSARAVRNRIDRLVERGYVAINAAAVPENLGFPINADIYIEAEPGKIQEVADHLCSLEQVSYVALSTGDTDISASVIAVDMHDLQTFITEQLHTISGVRKTRSYVLTTILKQTCNLPLPTKLPGM
jgi:Lrp/AsnC family transcriptional regulator for asnA, asnC and gidA